MISQARRANPALSSGGQVTLRIDDAVAHVTISNPGRRNAFTWRMYDQLEAIADQVAEDFALRAVVIRGASGEGFAAGTDIAQFLEFESGTDGVAYERRVGAVLERILATPVPVISLVDGAAVGAGLAITACTDLVIAERGSRFGAPIARSLGNCLPVAVVHRLRSRLGSGVANAMLLTGELIAAESLTGNGFVHQVVEPGGLDEAVAPVLRRIGLAAPLAVRALKESIRRLDQAMPLPEDEDLLLRCYGSADFHEGVDAFLAGRPASWKGH